MAVLLKIEQLDVRYGDIRAVKGINFDVKEREIVTLIGANGAGKTTTMNTIAGLIRPHAGRIMFCGEDITSAPPAEIVKAGVSLAPEGRQIFSNLTVLQNLEMGAYTVSKQQREEGIEQVLKLFPRLKERMYQVGGSFSGRRTANVSCRSGTDGSAETTDA